MFQFPGFASAFAADAGVASGGLPHSDIRASRDICSLARLFAACHVLLRLREPRHPSCALLSFPLTILRRKLFPKLILALYPFACARPGVARVVPQASPWRTCAGSGEFSFCLLAVDFFFQLFASIMSMCSPFYLSVRSGIAPRRRLWPGRRGLSLRYLSPRTGVRTVGVCVVPGRVELPTSTLSV